jgi:hypothetical protein
MRLRYLVPVAVLLLSACSSRIQLAYHQLDWLLPYYLETYMELSDEQSSYLEQEVEELLAWHCSTQLTVYAELLREVDADLQAGRMTRARLEDYNRRIQRLWRQILQQAGPAIATLLATASEKQLEELFHGFRERHEDWLSGFNEQTDAERRREYAERMTRELERWFGPLQSSQQQAVLAWSAAFTPLGRDGLQMRRRWQARLAELVAQRDAAAQFRNGLEALFLNPQALRTPVYQQRLDHNRTVTIDLLLAIGRQLDPGQRRHLAHEAASVAQDFEQLACNPDQQESPERITLFRAR